MGRTLTISTTSTQQQYDLVPRQSVTVTANAGVLLRRTSDFLTVREHKEVGTVCGVDKRVIVNITVLTSVNTTRTPADFGISLEIIDNEGELSASCFVEFKQLSTLISAARTMAALAEKISEREQDFLEDDTTVAQLVSYGFQQIDRRQTAWVKLENRAAGCCFPPAKFEALASYVEEARFVLMAKGAIHPLNSR